MKTTEEQRTACTANHVKMAESLILMREAIGDIPVMIDRAGDAELLKLLRSENGGPSFFDALQVMLRQLLMTAATYDEVVKGIQARAADLLARAQAQQPPDRSMN